MSLLTPFRRNRISPASSLSRLQLEVNDLFNSFFSNGRSLASSDEELLEPISTLIPSIDVYDFEDSVLVKTDMPGMKKEDIKVNVQGEHLYIQAERKEEKKLEEKGAIRQEIAHGTYSRAVNLPAGVDVSKIDAKYENGVLELSIPKKEEAKPKQIDIKIK